ncbi:MAG: histidine kinase N-terminal 7TM domain-containing protein [Lachnospiraceae bacterium]|nr:histidine kinase N-terminal 7TM domain-containing protein [Lachnospiraceae bacterium]
MNKIQKTIKRLAFYYLLIVLNALVCQLPDRRPFINISSFFLLALMTCLVLYYNYITARTGGLMVLMKALSWMAFLLILCRGLKYSVLPIDSTAARFAWYCFYIPLLLIPLFLFFISLLVSSKENQHIPKKWYLLLAVTIIFILLILTNDLHQLVFTFKPGFVGWDRPDGYSYNWVFYLSTAWQYGLYLAAILILLAKCRISVAREGLMIMSGQAAIGIWLIVITASSRMPRINGYALIQFPEAYVFMMVTVLECCLQLGLIPGNENYGRLFKVSSLAAQITDKKGRPVYISEAARPLSEEQFLATDRDRIDEHTVLRRMSVPGGYGFWQDDVTRLDRLNEELAEAAEQLSEEAALTRLKNELREKQAKIRQRILVYDAIASRTAAQSEAMSRLAAKARESEDTDMKEMIRRRITLPGAYIKRYANLMLIASESGHITGGELAISVAEVLRYLNYNGIPGEMVNTAENPVSSEAALATFEVFEYLLENNLPELSGVFVNLSDESGLGTAGGVNVKLTLENVRAVLPTSEKTKLAGRAVSWFLEYEDDVTYLGFTLPGIQETEALPDWLMVGSPVGTAKGGGSV